MDLGVNLIGYARAEFGLGEACRLAAKALESAKIPFNIINFPHCPARQNDLTWLHKEVNEPKYKTNLFFINADQLYYYYIKDILKRRWFKYHFNIAYWHWELPEFPKYWRRSFNLVNEIWTPSKYTSNSISTKTTKPVTTLPHGISVNLNTNFNRSYFGLPRDRFLFFTMYDIYSTSERKNPAAVIKAFKQAFKRNDHKVGLVLKINNAANLPNEIEKWKQDIAEYENIYVIDQVLNREEVNGLLNSIDSYVSLHRAEGFGLPLAEAMYLGKPVIATNWSGNIDFMNETNSCLVDYKLIKVGQDIGPYKANQNWADPDIYQASQHMKKLAGDQIFVKQIGSLGKQTIKSEFSPQTIGERYRLRLNQLGLL
ncbi:glycosyltransferase family 4 protein [Cytobacillus firmus]|uniref:glycosyltransferase family 4 protein n=1 Tax=Cytobacillus firmus TaxID=1399 RepID=UPI002495A577|nr:glycosyltransferase family 4 protein [Cytobacillus firmus]